MKSGESYDLKIRYYEHGIEKSAAGEISNIDTGNEDMQIIIGGKRESGGNIIWTISLDKNIVTFPPLQSDESEEYPYHSCYDSVNRLTMEKQQEYALAYVILNQDASFSTRNTENILLNHDFDKESILSEFDRVYIVTMERQ